MEINYPAITTLFHPSSSSSCFNNQVLIASSSSNSSTAPLAGNNRELAPLVSLPVVETTAAATDDHDRGETAVDQNYGGGKMKKIKGEAKRVKKPRYAFQTRSQVDILDDGYRWRKYGQKAVKNNKFPRSYYRCTHQGCNVKKQVQRLSKDEGVVVTTYEGNHTHPIEKSNDNFEHILNQMKIYSSF